MDESSVSVRHPAKYTRVLLPYFSSILSDYGAIRVLDPMAGTGRIHDLSDLLPGLQTFGIEIEHEWAAMHPRTRQGDALDLPWPDGYFDAIVVSPTYGNRMADHHDAMDGSRRNTYRHALGRSLSQNNSGALQWGDQYRDFHRRAWAESARVLRAGGVFVVNVKAHIRRGIVIDVPAWHASALRDLGLVQVAGYDVPCPGQRFGQNGEARVDSAMIMVFEKPIQAGVRDGD